LLSNCTWGQNANFPLNFPAASYAIAQSMPSGSFLGNQWLEAGTGITHTIPLRARIICTSPPGNPIVPGVINASAIVVVQYP